MICAASDDISSCSSRGSMARKWRYRSQKHGKKMARKWQKQGRSMAEAWPDGTATEHAVRKSQSKRINMQPNAETQAALKQAQADRQNNTTENLKSKLHEFLCMMLRELWTGPGHATEQATSISHDAVWALVKPCDHDDIVSEDKCTEIVAKKIHQWSKCRWRRATFYREPELLVHKKMFDVMTRDKEGHKRDELTFVDWCRRIDKHSFSFAGTATERAEAGFTSLARDILSRELTPEQKKDSKYQFREGRSVSNKQRSLINVILRKNLGDSRVSDYIMQHGVPSLLDLSLRSKPNTCTQAKVMLENFMLWHASLLNGLTEREAHPDMAEARTLSSVDAKIWRIQRRQKKAGTRKALKLGQRLVYARDSLKRKLQDMSATEQQVLKDFETGKSGKLHKKNLAKKLHAFRAVNLADL